MASTTNSPPNASKRMIVTASLPYANGPLHLGHALEYWQADIWARFQRLCGHECLYICGSDAHGTPIMLAAEKQNLDPETYVAQIQQQHAQDFAEALVAFDHFYTTESPEERELLNEIYPRLQAKGDITEKIIQQAYDTKAQMFLPDRYIKGQCPACGAKDQYGDNCEACGRTYSTTDLVEPYSVVSGSTPSQKQTVHYFFELANYTDKLRAWISDENHLAPAVANKMLEWFESGLQSWDITRDAPYFGIKIPGTEDKYFYVWLDAPLGYISIFQNYCSTQAPQYNWQDDWQTGSTTELHHFIGKDVLYFHALFWPAILMSADLRLPTSIQAHGFLTIGGKKMSKSRGTFITLRQYLEHFDPEYLRYYFAAKLTPHIEDIDLSPQDFVNRVNADLVGKFANIASRCARFINRDFNNQLASSMHDTKLWQAYVDGHSAITTAYATRNFAQAMRLIMELADLANQYIDQHKPWTLAKANPQDPQVQLICTQGLNCFRALALWLSPVLPATQKKVASFLNSSLDDWESMSTPLLQHSINTFTPLLTRLKLEDVTKILTPST